MRSSVANLTSHASLPSDRGPAPVVPLRADARSSLRAAGGDLPKPGCYLDERQLCAELGISQVTTTKWRARAEGPPFIKVGRLVRYRRDEVDAWLASRTIGERRCG